MYPVVLFDVFDNVLVDLNHSADVIIVAVYCLLLCVGEIQPKIVYHGKIEKLMILVMFLCKISINCCIHVDEMHRHTEWLNATWCDAWAFVIGGNIAGIVVICHGDDSQFFGCCDGKRSVQRVLFPTIYFWRESFRNMIYSNFVIVRFFIYVNPVLWRHIWITPKYIIYRNTPKITEFRKKQK